MLFAFDTNMSQAMCKCVRDKTVSQLQIFFGKGFSTIYITFAKKLMCVCVCFIFLGGAECHFFNVSF